MKKVLIIDDELEFLNDFGRGLEMFGYDVYKAGNGEIAFRIIETYKPDIILCDFRLPDMDGDKILKKTKRENPEIKFFLVTAYYDSEVEKRLKDLGADEVIFKPIVLTDIEKLLSDV